MVKPATAVAGSTPGGSPTRPTAQVQRGGSKPPGVGSPKNPKMKATSASESKPPIGAKNKARVVVKAKPDPTLARIPPPRPNPWAWITKYVDGMMFVCNSDTYEECLKIKLLGLPKQYLKNVQGLKAEQVSQPSEIYTIRENSIGFLIPIFYEKVSYVCLSLLYFCSICRRGFCMGCLNPRKAVAKI